MYDSAVARIGDKDIAARAEDDIVRRVEMRRAGARYIHFTDGGEQLPLGAELAQHMIAVIGGPDMALAVHTQPVRNLEQPLAPSALVLAIAIEGEQRRVAALQYVNPPGRIDSYTGKR